MLVGTVVKAQYSSQYYHRIGDTVEWRNPICYYQWWDAELFYNNRMKFIVDNSWLSTTMGGIRLCQYYTPDTMKIVGLCAMGFIYHNRLDPSHSHIITDSTEYLYLYDADSTDFVLKAQVPFRRFPPDSCRYLEWLQRGRDHYNGYHTFVDTAQCYGLIDRDSCCISCSYRMIFPMYEFYFDSTVYVTDSFYVGGSTFGNLVTGESTFPIYLAVTKENFMPSAEPWGKSCLDPGIPAAQAPDCWPQTFLYKIWRSQPYNYPNTPYQDWGWCELPQYLLIVPIIQVDTTVPVWNYCPPVENVQVSLVEDSCLILTWDDCVNYSSVTVRYGATSEGGVTQWHEIGTEDNIFRLCGIDTLSEYRFTLQAHCDTSKQETDWSEVLVYQYPVRHDVGTGDTPLSRHTHLVPNPAHESVVVNTGYTLRRIEVYNSRGILVYSEPAWGLTTTIDLTGWPSGSYIVVVGTQKGRTAKVLVKE